MRNVIIALSALLSLLWACSSPTEQLKPEDVAAQTACEYYKLLIAGRYSDFVSGTYGADSLDSAYRSQLVDNAAMYAERQKQHKGIKTVEPYKSTADTVNHVASVQLTITFGDGTKENILVPMVQNKGVWYMK